MKWIAQHSRGVLLAVGLAAAAMLAVALVAQYGFGLHPCELCMAQRYPYMAVIVVALLALLLPRRLQRAALLLILCLFLLDAGIAGYHTGVELKIFKGPDACTGESMAGKTLEEMRAALAHAALVACDQPALHFLGLSMAAWNGIGALLLSLAAGYVWYVGRGENGATG